MQCVRGHSNTVDFVDVPFHKVDRVELDVVASVSTGLNGACMECVSALIKCARASCQTSNRS